MAGPKLYSPYDKVMWQTITDQAMKMQSCAECKTFRYPPGACCPNCLSVEYTWEPIKGTAKVLSWITYHKQYLPAYPVPTTIVAAQTPEGPILITNMDTSEVENIALDKEVHVIYGDHPDGYKIPRYTLKA